MYPFFTVFVLLCLAGCKNEVMKLAGLVVLLSNLLDCVFGQIGTSSELDCEMLPFFELGSVHYKSYLVNLRLPVGNNANQNLGPVKEMWAYVSFLP